MCASVNLSQLRLSVRRLEQEIAEPCCREERMAGGAAVNTPNTCRRKERMAGGAAVNTPNTCRRKERMAGGAAVNTPNTCRRKQRRELFPSSRPDDADWLFPAPPDTLTVYRHKMDYDAEMKRIQKMLDEVEVSSS
ncbi:uncharacterized protein LOC135116414 isoform X3 [Scylla paramamosain]|uniref:uncharacterized protein LOC135116414 isoform X3 n=1 Tax=Scylla paramamosain TaxID=85552 RepID=UPI00308305EA